MRINNKIILAFVMSTDIYMVLLRRNIRIFKKHLIFIPASTTGVGLPWGLSMMVQRLGPGDFGDL